MPRYMEIGKKIKALREAKGLSKYALAKACGVSPPVIQHWETGSTSPNNWNLPKVAAALGTSTDQLLEGEEGERTSPPTSSIRTVPVVIDAARNEIAAITGMPVSNVRVNVEFVSN